MRFLLKSSTTAALLLCSVSFAQAQNAFPGTQPVTAPEPSPAPGNEVAPGLSPEQQMIIEAETRDYGVPAPGDLHLEAMHAPTPNHIPGAQLITTVGVQALLQDQSLQTLILDALGGPEEIPGAINVSPAAYGQSSSDEMQQTFSTWIDQATQGNRQTPVLVYCLSDQCWLSYNVALRAVKAGYSNVLWYRGGIEAWKANGGSVVPSIAP